MVTRIDPSPSYQAMRRAQQIGNLERHRALNGQDGVKAFDFSWPPLSIWYLVPDNGAESKNCFTCGQQATIRKCVALPSNLVR